MCDITLEAMTGFVREMEDTLSTVTPMERAIVVALLFKQAQKNNDFSSLLLEKFDAHRKLIGYEQQAFNQLRKNSLVNK